MGIIIFFLLIIIPFSIIYWTNAYIDITLIKYQKDIELKKITDANVKYFVKKGMTLNDLLKGMYKVQK